MNNNKVKCNRLIKIMFAWCIDNHDKKSFCCEAQLTGYVDWVQIKISSGDHDSPIDKLEKDYIPISDYKALSTAFIAMKKFKAWHDEYHTPELVAQRAAESKAKKIARLNGQLKSLGED